VVHNITRRALLEKFEHWNSVWKAVLATEPIWYFGSVLRSLAAMSETAHLMQMFDSIVARAHVLAAGAKGQHDQALGRSRCGFSTIRFI
jgi:hypothetical protein